MLGSVLLALAFLRARNKALLRAGGARVTLAALLGLAARGAQKPTSVMYSDFLRRVEASLFPNSGNWFHSMRRSTAEVLNARPMEPRIVQFSR